MQDLPRATVLLGLMLLCAACASTPTRASLGQLQARATYDLACPTPWMRVYHLDDATKGVVGCGLRATYVERCDGTAEGRCTWALDMQVASPVAQVTPNGSTAGSADPLGDRH